MKKKKIVDRAGWLALLNRKEKMLYAMYSSVTDCIVTDPSVMVVPVDDHIVHRGDGVFESFKCLDGNLYNLRAHLERLQDSCAALDISYKQALEEIEQVVIQTVRAGNQPNALVRLLVSRGCGTMGVNPYDCTEPEWYVVVYELPEHDTSALPEGATLGISKIAVKPGIFATVKTCNYLPNILMKKEAIDLGLDFTVSIDEKRNIAEGAVENIGIVTRGHELVMPPPDRVLAGTTAQRTMALAEKLVETRALVNAEYRPVTMGMLRAAVEVHMYGTTTNITPIISLDGVPVGDGKVGPVTTALFDLLKEDMVPDSSRLTKVF